MQGVGSVNAGVGSWIQGWAVWMSVVSNVDELGGQRR